MGEDNGAGPERDDDNGTGHEDDQVLHVDDPEYDTFEGSEPIEVSGSIELTNFNENGTDA